MRTGGTENADDRTEGAPEHPPDNDPAQTIAWRDLAASGIGSSPEIVSPVEPAASSGETPSAQAEEVARFIRRVVEAGLVEPEEISEAVSRLSSAEGRPTGVGSLARDLVRNGRLTPYQTAAVFQAKTKGLMIGNYVVLDKVGAGGMGIVFKARHRTMKRVVAIKVLPPSVTRDAAAVARFQREARAAASLSHPNVVAALHADEFKGVYFLVMEYVEGQDLSRRVADLGPLPLAESVDVTLQAARGLREAHARGIVHRDIKPSNLLLDGRGVLKVSDLGLARVGRPDDPLAGPDPKRTELTRDGMMMGTVDFMPPEQAFNSRLADERSDIYSLGCTLFFLLTGRVPFPAASVVARVLAHREHPFPTVREDRPDVPESVDQVLRAMTAKAPTDRYPTMGDLAAALETLKANLPATASEAPPRPLNLDRSYRDASTAYYPRPEPLPVASTVTMFRGASGRGRALPSRFKLATLAGVLGLAAVGFFARPGRVPTPTTLVSQGTPPREVSKPPTPAPKSPDVPAAPPSPDPTVPDELNGPGSTAATGLVAEFGGETPDDLLAIAVSADGRHVLTGGRDGVARYCDRETGRVSKTFRNEGAVFAVALAPDGRRAVTAAVDQTVRLWDLRTGEELGRFKGHSRRVNAVAVSPGGGRLLTGSDDLTARVWDMETLSEVARVDQGGRVVTVAFGLGGRLAISGGTGASLRFWNPEGGGEPTSGDPGGEVFCLAVTPDGASALSGCDDGRLTLWDLNRLAPTRTLDGGPTDYTLSAAFLPDGNRLLTGYLGGTLLLWDVATGTIGYRFADQAPGRLGVAAVPGGRLAVTADEDGRWRLWRLPTPERDLH